MSSGTVAAAPPAEPSRALPATLFIAAAVTLALGILVGRGGSGFVAWIGQVAQHVLFATSAGLVIGGLVTRSPEGVAELSLRWEMATRREALRSLALTGAQLGLLWLAFVRFSIENEAFYQKIAVLAFSGFVVNYFLPLRQRLLYFFVLSLLGIVTVMGMQNGAWLLAIGLVLMGVCHLPIRYGARVALLVGIGGLLALGRVERLPVPWSTALWPIMGSFFMFRLIVYLYDMEHAKEKPTVLSALSYFFLLPNVVFPFFPVVDYTVFRKQYYDEEEFAIYQRGVRWMMRGTLQLIAYRVVYQYLTIPITSVHTAADVGIYMLTTYLLYIRVSGQFHLVTGMLHLFGFNLPRTHNRYFLASSMLDYWRRINIYWKDFMLKLVFYPVYFRLKKYGEVRALVLGTSIVFVATWLLHSYQWFWLLGEFPLTWNDVIMWGVIGGAVVVNTLYERKRKPGRQLQPATFSFRTHAPVVLRTAATFVFICVLWSLWTSPSVTDWVAMVSLN